MPESDFDRRVREIADTIYRGFTRGRSDDDVHRLIEETSPAEFEELCRKHSPGGVGQSEFAAVVKRLRERQVLVPVLGGESE